MTLKELIKSQNFKKIKAKNGGLVYNISESNMSSQIPQNILIHEGNVGLFKASLKFSKNSNNAFSTFAYKYIEGEIKDFKQLYNSLMSSQDRVVRLSRKIEIIAGDLHLETDEEPSIEYLVNKLNESSDNITDAMVYNKVNIQSISVNNDGDVDFLEILEQTVFESAINIVDQKYISKVVKDELSSLKSKNREVILRMFAIPPYEKMSQKKISEHLGISQTRISEIHSSTIIRLKENKQLKELYEEIKN